MSSNKDKTVEKNSGNVCKKRQVIKLKQKLEIIKRMENGERITVIASSLGMPQSTISTIIKQSNEIKESIKRASNTSSSNVISRKRNELLEEMEKILNFWINHQNERNCPISGSIIKEKALRIWDELMQQKCKKLSTSRNTSKIAENKFVASNGWLQKFQRRYHLHSIKKTGEAASADTEAAQKFVIELQTIIKEGGYRPEQVFNLDETGLNWKKLPERTYISRNEKTSPGFKASKERITLVLGGNATGDFKLKPLLIGKSENPRALKNVIKTTLPVIYKSNTKAWMTSLICFDYVKNYLVPAITNYNRQMNFENKALLLLDNAPGHPQSLQEISENIKIVFLPPNTTSIIQPMDQGVIGAFKANYLRYVVKFIIDESEKNNKLSLIDVWKKYDFKKSIENIGLVWSNTKTRTMNAVWRKLWPEVVTEPEGVNYENVTEAIISMATNAGIEGLDREGISKLVNGTQEEMTVSEIQTMLIYPDSKESEDNVISKNLSASVLKNFLNKIEDAVQIIKENDPDYDRCSKVNRSIKQSIMCYEELYSEKLKHQRQATLDSFFKK